MKRVVFTDEAERFAEGLDEMSRKKLARELALLEDQGFLRFPMAEKVMENLFAMRILTAGNERFFYCYDDGTLIYVLSGYTKKAMKIPKTELNHALAIKKGLGL